MLIALYVIILLLLFWALASYVLSIAKENKHKKKAKENLYQYTSQNPPRNNKPQYAEPTKPAPAATEEQIETSEKSMTLADETPETINSQTPKETQEKPITLEVETPLPIKIDLSTEKQKEREVPKAPQAKPTETIETIQDTKLVPQEDNFQEIKQTNESEDTPTQEIEKNEAKETTVKLSQRLSAPNEGQRDDLKEIKGVGLKFELMLNTLGYYHFEQIANWTKEDIEFVKSKLRFGGRIERDDWIGQCKTLAKSNKNTTP